MAKLALLVVASAAFAGSLPQVLARIPTGDSPGAATAAYGAVWVTNDAAGTLARIDPQTNWVTRRARLKPGVFSVTHGFGALWVVNYKRNTLTRVDPSSMRARSVRVGAVPDGLLAAYGRVWVTAWEAGRLVEVDPRSLKVVRRTRIGPRPSGLRAAAGAVWVGFGRTATAVARVDPRTHRIERVSVGVRAPAVFSVGTRDLDQGGGQRGRPARPPHEKSASPALVRRHACARSTGPDGTIWLPDKELNVIHRVDPKTSTVVDSFAGGSGAFFPLRAFGSMWVTSYAGSDVWRFKPAGR